MTIRMMPVSREPLLTTSLEGRALRVAVLTGSYGAGHDAAARELATLLRAAGHAVEVHDIVDLLPWRLGRVLRTAYYAQLRRHPSSWGATLQLLEPGRPLHRVVTRSLGIAAAPVAAAVRDCDLVVTTHPFGAQALGHARATGQLSAPAVTYFTDASVHSLWVHSGIDLNLAIHQVAADDARRWNASATVVTPLVPMPEAGPGLGAPRDPLEAHGLTGARALVAGGSMGMGELGRTCQDILETGQATPVVLCGNDDSLRRRLTRIPGVVALGWRDDVARLMASSDCVVQNAGGFTSLEALAWGTPVITYRPLPGHGVANSANLERAGLVPWARTVRELAVLLAEAKGAPRVDRLPRGASDVVTVLTGQRQTTVAA